eukprot:GDKJ01013894.1.p1 GENE.GDKJ01013894.1~~GDKJ01013894.1.p1  ORF type:complete len:338 (-),score=9.34 GDKJ01013894.1:56-1069(-)
MPFNSKIIFSPLFFRDAFSFFQKMIRYLSDTSLYTHVIPPTKLKVTGFSSGEEQSMLNKKFAVHTSTVKGSVYGFKVSEFQKKRSRAVWNCYIKVFFQDRLPHYHTNTPSSIFKRLHIVANENDTIFVQFDFAAYYDQFQLHQDVRDYFCFQGRNGEIFSLTRLPMGFSLACAIAQATTWQFLNFQKQSEIITCIDNVAFTGSIHKVHHDIVQFLQRVNHCDATLNELTSNQIQLFLNSSEQQQRQQLLSWHKADFTFLGVRYDWTKKTRALSEKTLEKLQATQNCFQALGTTIKPRQLAAIIGILRYASMIPGRLGGIMGYSRGDNGHSRHVHPLS